MKLRGNVENKLTWSTAFNFHYKLIFSALKLYNAYLTF